MRLLAKVDQQRTGSTKATLGYTLDAWLQVHEADEQTLEGYRGYAERAIKPALGDVPIAKVSARVLEQFHAQLRRCRARCNGKAHLEHVTDEPHDECNQVVHRRVRDHDPSADQQPRPDRGTSMPHHSRSPQCRMSAAG
ncbi:hypothetical protein [Actinopolymorpha alba]|uniref:hypothetical protein n=1 Tax=Actinopolymorpha alba TaxID=533267 RepID=UPI00037ED0EF|nr:hypothetical protein [Actinopolymorpha alba]